MALRLLSMWRKTPAPPAKTEPLRARFQPTAEVKFARDDDAFIEAIEMSPENAFIRGKTKKGVERPLDYLYLINPLQRLTAELDEIDYSYFYIQDSKGVILAAAQIQIQHHLEYVGICTNSVRPEARGKGYGKTLQRAIIQKANELGYQLNAASTVMELGWRLIPGYPDLHAEFPDLKIGYGHNNPPIDGHRPYTLHCTDSEGIEIVYDQ